MMGVYSKGDNSINSGQLTQTEVDIYGSSRLGMWKPNINVQTPTCLTPLTVTGMPTGYFLNFVRGQKLFELSNHLGNVLATITDKKIPVSTNGTTVAYYTADVVSAQDYYPFGMLQPGRTVSSGNYRYGFNGKETDKNITSEDYDYGARIYDARIGRFLSVDPLERKYPWYSVYQFSGNNPIKFIDIDGLEPGVKGTVKGAHDKYTNQQLKDALALRTASIHSGISIDYIVAMARQEDLSLTMYDLDGDKDRGGNATIGFGSLFHLGTIGNVYYDKDAIQKEAKYKSGITFEQAVDMFIEESNANAKDLNNWFKSFKVDKSLTSQNVIDVLADIYFNSGTKNTKKAFQIYADNGKQGLINAIKNEDISNASDERKKFRLGILENNYSTKDFVPKKTNQDKKNDAPMINYTQKEIEKNYKNTIVIPNINPS